MNKMCGSVRMIGVVAALMAILGHQDGEAAETSGVARAKAPESAQAPEKYYFAQTSNQATVVTATFLGGPGHEWLVGGGWQDDGAVVLAGNVLGPLLKLGAPTEVIGADDAPPPATETPAIGSDDKGRGVAVWNMPDATGFLVKCEPDLRKIVSVRRFPWMAGVITSAVVDSSNAVYVAGIAGATIAKLGGRQEQARMVSPLPEPKPPKASPNKGKKEPEKTGPPSTDKPVSCRVFLAKITPDLQRCEWMHLVEGFVTPPQLRLLPNGTLWLAGQDVQVLDTTGRVLSTAPVAGGVGTGRAVNPVDGSIARLANRGNWSTGREPWKCPGIRILNPDGSDRYQLYEWDGRYVGLDNHRSVADTSVGALAYDYSGNLFFYAWSDGGNQVIRYQAHDIRRPHGCPGLLFPWGGTGYNVVKLEGEDYNTVGCTKWQAETAHGVKIMRMNTLVPMADGNLCIAGMGGPKGVHETKSSLMPEGPSGGNYVAILNRDLASAVFSSVVGGAGEINIGSRSWSAVSGTVNGRRKILLLTGAKETNTISGLAPTAEKTPTTNAMQNAFGGGMLDGYVVLLDVPSPTDTATRNLPTRFDRLSFEILAGSKKDTALLPEDGAVFYFDSEFPRFVTADIEVRDAADCGVFYGSKETANSTSGPAAQDGGSNSGGSAPTRRGWPRWPNFAYGRSVQGELAWREGKFTGQATVSCSHWVQQEGDQRRRVLGELLTGGSTNELPAMTFTVSDLGEMKTQEIPVTDAPGKGKPAVKFVRYVEAQGKLEFAGRTLTVPVKCVIKYQTKLADNGVPGLAMETFFTVKGRDLGLTAMANDEIDMRVGMRGTLTKSSPPTAKRAAPPAHR